MIIAIHTARIWINDHEQIIAASQEKGDVMKAAKEWKEKYPGRPVRIESTLEEVER